MRRKVGGCSGSRSTKWSVKPNKGGLGKITDMCIYKTRGSTIEEEEQRGSERERERTQRIGTGIRIGAGEEVGVGKEWGWEKEAEEERVRESDRVRVRGRGRDMEGE